MLDFPEPKFDILKSRLGSVMPGLFQHGWRHVHADHPASRLHLARGKKSVKASASAQIENYFTRLKRSDRLGIATTKTQV
jgi:hypothetical protein